MKKKHIALIVIISLIICMSGVLTLLGGMYIFVASGAVFSLMPNPLMPEITYGEFPISVAYEVDGEIKVNEDIVICEFDGIENLGSAGKYRKWKAYLKGGDSNFGFFSIGKNDIELEVGIFIGSPNYYMGDFEQSRELYEKSMVDDRYREYVEWKNGIKTGNVFTKEEVWEKYRFRIIDIQYSQPIENTFK